jgi:phosphatidylinositol alpha-1,6-mannosyltransferase
VKVLYLTPQPKRAGELTAYSFLDEEIHALADAGIQAYVLSRRAAKRDESRGVTRWPVPRERALGSRSRSIGFMLRTSAQVPPANLAAVTDWYQAARIERVAAALVRQEHIDVVHSHFGWPGGFGGSLLRSTTKVPLLACLRGADILVDSSIGYGGREREFYDRNVRQLLRTADRTLYFSDFMKDEGVRLGAHAQRTRILQKAVDLSQFGVIEDRARAREELGFGRRPMILTVGALIPRKGIDLVLEALARLRGTFDFSFVVCGEGPEREHLQSLATRLSLADRTFFAGRVSRQDIPKFFGACEIFVLASVLEAAGNVLFEAMAAARPIVCTAAGGPSEYVEDGVSGYVVPVRDIEALSARMGELLADPALRDRLGATGRQRALTQYAYPRLVRDIIAVYDEVLEQRRAPGRARGLRLA